MYRYLNLLGLRGMELGIGECGNVGCEGCGIV